MPFQDQSGKVVLPKLDRQGNLPVAEPPDVTEILAELVNETRAVRIGLELLNKLKVGELVQMARARSYKTKG